MSADSLQPVVINVINITRQTTGITTANFSNVLFLSKTATSRCAPYRSVTEVAKAGYATNSNEYLAAVAFFSEPTHPAKLFIAKHSTSPTETIVEALDAAKAVSNEWYGLCIDDITVKADITSAAAWCKTNKKQLFAATNDPTVWASTDTTSIAYLLNTANATKALTLANRGIRTAVDSNSAKIAAQFAEVAYAATVLSRVVGSYTTENLPIQSAVVDDFTSAELGYIAGKNAQCFIDIYGQSRTHGAKNHSSNSDGGEWTDVEIGIDWIEVRMKEAVITTLLNADKIPYTDKGIAIIENSVEDVLKLGVRNGLFSTYTNSSVPAASVSSADKIARTYGGISWTATLAGAIHTATISGTVKV